MSCRVCGIETTERYWCADCQDEMVEWLSDAPLELERLRQDIRDAQATIAGLLMRMGLGWSDEYPRNVGRR